jgi:hypothetical protein
MGTSRRAISVGLVAMCLVTYTPACGDDTTQIQATVKTFFDAIGDGEGEEACQQLTTAARAQLVSFTDHTPCPRAAEHAPPVLERLMGFSLEDVTLEEVGLAPADLCEFDRIRFSRASGETAVVPCIARIPLVNTAEGWRISNLDWYVEPL